MRILTRILLAGLSALFFVACTKNTTEPTSTQPTKNTATAFNHRAFDELLSQHVNKEGWVNYEGLKKDREKLNQYLATLATAKPQELPDDAERLAFWINSYNAFTLADVLDDVYGKVKSVQDVKGFFNAKKHKIAWEGLTLDEIEKRGRDMKDPRIHFAVNCASKGCPKLQTFAYNGAQLDLHLTKAAREFLGDSGRGMSFDPGRNLIYLSPIFKWYAADFTGSNAVVARVKAEASGTELLEVAKQYIPSNVAQFIAEKKMEVKWMEYDWSLNAQETQK
ncbi:MAG: DUF547 domain-containing protein [Acidobacteria bacterium]|nr:DUF547 domain-containing protein [Acidobacteriota bacterium]